MLVVTLPPMSAVCATAVCPDVSSLMIVASLPSPIKFVLGKSLIGELIRYVPAGIYNFLLADVVDDASSLIALLIAAVSSVTPSPFAPKSLTLAKSSCFCCIVLDIGAFELAPVVTANDWLPL